nr:PAS domain-containing protein [Verrucomicrobium spinosum]
MPSPPNNPLSHLPATGVLGLLEMLGPTTQAWIKDRQGRYQWVNRAFLLNYSLEQLDEVVGKTDADLSPAHLADQFRTDDEWVLAGGRIVNRVELVGRFDHTATWSITNKVLVRDSRGRLFGTAGTTRAVGEAEAVLAVEDARLSAVVSVIRAHVAQPLETAAWRAWRGSPSGPSSAAFASFFMWHRSSMSADCGSGWPAMPSSLGIAPWQRWQTTTGSATRAISPGNFARKRA